MHRDLLQPKHVFLKTQVVFIVSEIRRRGYPHSRKLLCVRGTTVLGVLAGRWPFGPVVCDLFNANDVLFSTASLLHLCCVSVDRYVAVTDPFGYERRMTVRRVAAMLAALWSASALLGHLPIHLGCDWLIDLLTDTEAD